ncbi:hypothetical protein VB712_10665 [Spirulina sp. CCNP1310]|uniref:hypothetical protein n=1 Tax=Spirulina sp. CCNP1310 TaxID=3110249 RepID=UPI002B1F6CCF|nr:hypothetical protein [Spirulina sp. CCNP1310]MEA5419684.1 hypothetical protein [Spirulina sp. CCNP1310]
MLAESYYLLRSQQDGQYVTARPHDPQNRFLLLFRENFEARSYLNTHGSDVSDRFGVEPISQTQLKALLDRWGFKGVGIVTDPLIPTVDFLTYF